MHQIRHTTIRALAMGIVASAGAAPILAADAPDAVLQEVIVTATKRNENVRDIPVAMSALTGADLAASNANSLSDYITRVPGVVFNDYQPGISEVVIRGVSATTYHEQGQTTVGYYLNEVVLVEPGFPIGIPDIDTFDLDRVEVLRGPQGTLFGSSALGGLVNYIARTADPKKFDSAAQALLGSGKNQSGDVNYAIKGMVNVPLIDDKLAVRVTALQRFDAGYLDNPGTGVNGSNDFRTRGLRTSVVFTPSDTTKITFLSAYQDTQLDDQTYVTLGTYLRDTPRAEPQKTDFWLSSLRLDQDLQFATLTVLGSYDKKNNTTVFTYPYAYVTGVTTGAAAAYDIGKADAKIKTIEARLASKGDGPWRWLIGSSYMRADKFSADHIYQQGAAAFIDANPGDFGGYPGSVLAPGDSIYGYIADTSNKDFGVFGELSFRPVKQIELSVGGRYFDTKNSATITNAAGSLGAGSFTPADTTFGTTQKEGGFTPKATVAYRPNGSSLLYVTYSEGFRVGGPNPNAAILAGIPKSYQSDTVKNYEIGTKLTLLDHRLLLDLTAFHLDWKNIQARLFTDAPYYYSYVTNAGSAKIDGLEFSVAYQLNHWVNFSTNGTYQNARLSTFLPDTFAVGGGYPAGTTLPGSSKWSIANNLKFQFAEVRGAPGLELAHRYLSRAPVAFGNPPPAERGNFNVFDLRAFIGIGDNYRVLAFVDNLLDKYGVLNAPFSTQTVPAGSIIRPRTYGLRLDWKL
jgi:iron complex outermembrane receptor protein